MSLINNKNNNESGLRSSIPLLCKNDCGFFGSKSTMDMCSKFYMDNVQANLARLTINDCHVNKPMENSSCRCGNFYLSNAPYSEIHACTYDYKSVGRGMIATTNPLVKQDKLMERI
ncbi:hypothetical protein MKW92_046033 [Papaver armeniacum]|nr:hypothetical protein MKW92_046033 [Papaver armeniacum]